MTFEDNHMNYLSELYSTADYDIVVYCPKHQQRLAAIIYDHGNINSDVIYKQIHEVFNLKGLNSNEAISRFVVLRERIKRNEDGSIPYIF